MKPKTLWKMRLFGSEHNCSFSGKQKSQNPSILKRQNFPIWIDSWWPFLFTGAAYDLVALPNISSNYGMRVGRARASRGTDSQICHSAARSPTLPRLNCWLVIEDCDRHEKCEKWYDDECEKKNATQILYSLTRALFGLYWRLQPDKALDVLESVEKFFVQTRLHIKLLRSLYD